MAQIAANPFAARPTTEFWTVLRHADAVHVLTHPEVFPSEQGPGPDRMVQSDSGGVLIFADGAVHLRQRRLAAKAFTPRAVALVTPRIQATVDDIIDAIAGEGSAELMSTLGVPMAMRTVLEILGVPLEREHHFHRWGTAIDKTFGGNPDAIEAGGIALAELFSYLQTLIDAARSAAPPVDGSRDEGVLAALVHAEHAGSRLSDEEICQIVMQLAVAGYETTSTALVNGVHALISNPEQRQLFVRADAASLRAAVEEVLRYDGPQAGLFRTAAQDVEVGGCPIPADAKVRVAFASANRDEAAFAEPDQFRIDRDLGELRTHIAFGLGPHACIGAALARAELRIALETVFRRLPGLRIDDARPSAHNATMLTIKGFRELYVRWDPSTTQPRRASH